MKVLLISIFSIFVATSCSHHHKDLGGHHHHKCKMKSCSMESIKRKPFNKHCAMSVSMGDMHVEGKKEFALDHA
jgi:hypothetical protein